MPQTHHNNQPTTRRRRWRASRGIVGIFIACTGLMSAIACSDTDNVDGINDPGGACRAAARYENSAVRAHCDYRVVVNGVPRGTVSFDHVAGQLQGPAHDVDINLKGNDHSDDGYITVELDDVTLRTSLRSSSGSLGVEFAPEPDTLWVTSTAETGEPVTTPLQCYGLSSCVSDCVALQKVDCGCYCDALETFVKDSPVAKRLRHERRLAHLVAAQHGISELRGLAMASEKAAAIPILAAVFTGLGSLFSGVSNHVEGSKQSGNPATLVGKTGQAGGGQ